MSAVRFACVVLLGSMAALAEETASVAKVTVGSGTHAGKYTLVSADACIIAAMGGGKPAGFNAVLTGEKSMLSIDIPNVDPQHIGDFQVELVLADPNGKSSRKQTASTTYAADTRPDAVLEPYQLKERGSNGRTGRGSVKLAQQGSTAQLQFSIATAQGVKLEGTVECRKVDREYGR